mmetsp:Transcript_65164/g.165198  ORF Transcript_65164/g.165198 Transcript_65164/m.165198 type:complete len:80 (-) Transcript_65164:1889-2128(-)
MCCTDWHRKGGGRHAASMTLLDGMAYTSLHGLHSRFPLNDTAVGHADMFHLPVVLLTCTMCTEADDAAQHSRIQEINGI